MFINEYVISMGSEELRCNKCGHMSQIDVYMIGISIEKCDYCTSMEEDVLDRENKCLYCGKSCGYDRLYCNNDCYDSYVEQPQKCGNPECDNMTTWHFCSDECLQAIL